LKAPCWNFGGIVEQRNGKVEMLGIGGESEIQPRGAETQTRGYGLFRSDRKRPADCRPRKGRFDDVIREERGVREKLPLLPVSQTCLELLDQNLHLPIERIPRARKDAVCPSPPVEPPGLLSVADEEPRLKLQP